MPPELTSGVLETIMNGGSFEEPVMQILGSKKMGLESAPERYRLLVSDGKYLNSFVLLAAKLNNKVLTGELFDFTIIRVNHMVTSMVCTREEGERRVMIILDLSVLAPGSEVGERIGNPVTLVESQNLVSPKIATVTCPLRFLNPYSNLWTIKAKVTAKSPVEVWNNGQGGGRLFTFDLEDESGDMRCTGCQEIVDKYYDMIEIGKVYYISNCTVYAVFKRDTHIKHKYEMMVSRCSNIVLCRDDGGDYPFASSFFTPLDRVQSMKGGSVIDVIGVCQSANNTTTIRSRLTGNEYSIRDVTLVDESGSSISVTLRNAQAKAFDGEDFPVVALINVSVREFRGVRTLSCTRSSIIQINPDIPQTHSLHDWYLTSYPGTQNPEGSEVRLFMKLIRVAAVEAGPPKKLTEHRQNC